MKKILWLLLPACLLFCVGADASGDPEKRPSVDVPFVEMPDYAIAEILSLARVGPGDVFYDLGSGDGRIVIAAAKKTGCHGVGIEKDPDLVAESRQNAVRAGVADRVRFIAEDIFKERYNSATVVTLYMSEMINRRIRPKLLREMKPGTRVASFIFDMGDWKPDEVASFGVEDAQVWIIPANASGTWRWQEGKGRTAVRGELRLTQAFQDVSGTLRRGGITLPIRNGRLRGDTLSFTVEPSGGASISYAGRIRGDALTLSETADVSVSAWEASRQPATRQRIDR